MTHVWWHDDQVVSLMHEIVAFIQWFTRSLMVLFDWISSTYWIVDSEDKCYLRCYNCHNNCKHGWNSKWSRHSCIVNGRYELAVSLDLFCKTFLFVCQTDSFECVRFVTVVIKCQSSVCWDGTTLFSSQPGIMLKNYCGLVTLTLKFAVLVAVWKAGKDTDNSSVSNTRRMQDHSGNRSGTYFKSWLYW